MDTIDDADVDGDIMEAQELGQQLIDAILEGAPSEDIHALVDAHAPLWYQAPDGTSALHAAAYAGDAALIKLLIDKGAIWNASACPRFPPAPTAADHTPVDDLQNTAGDIALSLNDGAAYELIRDAGLRTGTAPPSAAARVADRPQSSSSRCSRRRARASTPSPASSSRASTRARAATRTCSSRPASRSRRTRMGRRCVWSAPAGRTSAS
jgi:protein arginine N-methyltransferase 2